MAISTDPRICTDDLAAVFENPPVAFRGKPFWSWNGKLEKSELLRQVRIFQEMGMGGFFMHSRTGLRTEYLGDEWFDLVNACADEAERLGMEAWLYDEDRWPSGSAGGLATEDPRYRAKMLRLTIVDAEKLAWPEERDFVVAFVARFDSESALAFTECQPLAFRAVPPADGRRVLLFTTELMPCHSFYNGFTYLDTLQREATEHFLKITHERYRERCGKRLGHSIRGIFTDEPHHGTVMCENNENRAGRDQRWTTPWTESLFDEFQKTWSYDLRAHLPELFLFPEGRRVSRIKWHYMELLQRMFLENWARPLREWCRAHGLALTGHVLHEDSLVAQAVPGGSVMRYYEHLDVPGVDVLALHNRNYWIVKQLSSAARQLGRKWMLSELYGCTGWQLDFAGHKRIGDWQALLGVNVRCHHLSWVTMGGEAKRDYPASIHFQSAWHRQYAAVEDYFARLHVLMQRGDAVCDVLVINPVESTWAQIHPGWAQWLGALDPELEKLEQIHRDVFTWLSAAHVDFDYGDEDHLARFGQIERGESGALLRVGEAAYQVVVVAGMVTIRASTLRLLEEFGEAGGRVIFAGEPPAHVDAIASEAASALASRVTRMPLEETRLSASVRAASGMPLRVEAGGSRELLCQLRRDGATWIVALLNTSETVTLRDVRVTLSASGAVEEWECASGRRFAQPAEKRDDALEWMTELPPLGGRVFVVAPETNAPPRPTFVASGAIALTGPFAYELDEPNICVLDFAAFQIDSEPWQPAAEILQIDGALRERFGFEPRSGAMLQPWAAAKRGPGKAAPPSHTLRLRFSFDAVALPSTAVDLLVENPRAFRISVNGIPVAVPDELAWHIDPCFKRLPLPANALRIGENTVELETEFTSESELEAIHLLGDFGVALEGSRARLTALPPRIEPTDVVAQGLPFYSGKITYRLPLPAFPHSASAARIDLGHFGGAVACIRAPDAARGELIAFPPFTADVPPAARELLCDVWLTRRNTFGPLHLAPREQPFIGPMSFRSEGAEFTREYQLFPSGLLTPPRLVFGAHSR
jgi:hypothetical protein